MKIRFFLIVFSIFDCLAFGQSVQRLGLEGNYGFIIPHSAQLRPVSQSSPLGITANYQWMSTGNEAWNACNCFHFLGLQASYHHFGNPEVMGSAYSISGTFEPILFKNENLRFSLLTGIGVSYLDRVYDSQANPENLFFSAPISFLGFVTPKLEYIISPTWSGQLSFAYNHISNGGQSQPNNGINYPMLGAGVSHYFHQATFPEYSGQKIPKKWDWYLETGYTHRKAQWTEGRKPVLALTGGVYRAISAVNALGGGVELTKDYALEVENSRLEALMPAPFIAHHFLFGRFDFSQRMAMYIRKPSGYNGHRFYQRYMLQYRLYGHFYTGVSLKVHGHVAENMDGRVMWKF